VRKKNEELTEPGFIHDTFSATHTIFKLSAAYAELGDEFGRADFITLRRRRDRRDRAPETAG